MYLFKMNEPAHNKTYSKSCATSKVSDQPAHLRRLIRVLAYRMFLLLGYSKRDERGPLPYRIDVQADLSLCCSHRSYCRFCGALVGIISVCHSIQLILP